MAGCRRLTANALFRTFALGRVGPRGGCDMENYAALLGASVVARMLTTDQRNLPAQRQEPRGQGGYLGVSRLARPPLTALSHPQDRLEERGQSLKGTRQESWYVAAFPLV